MLKFTWYNLSSGSTQIEFYKHKNKYTLSFIFQNILQIPILNKIIKLHFSKKTFKKLNNRVKEAVEEKNKAFRRSFINRNEETEEEYGEEKRVKQVVHKARMDWMAWYYEDKLSRTTLTFVLVCRSVSRVWNVSLFHLGVMFFLGVPFSEPCVERLFVSPGCDVLPRCSIQ
uniref:Uncharacterized protein n=1 Tax=Timema genevievae TaxID=629358 RepID=A0A7R9K6W1_TIMGE|nr:unnamed protein product [Timema genevievae]